MKENLFAERFMRTLKNKIYKYMISVSKYVYIDKLNNIVNKHNNTYHNTMKIKPVDAKSNLCINSSKDINGKNPKFKIGDIVKISKYKIIFAKSYGPNWSEAVCIVISDFKGEEIVRTFYEKELQKINQKEFRVEKVIKRKGDKLYVKWKGYDRFN